ncbi:MAG: glycosyltransferase family 4 protein [Candidatus Puniceispirillaceae bacterium]
MSSNLHIAHLTSAHPRFDTRVFAKMCTSVVAKGWHCSLVVADGKGDAQKDGVHIYDIGKPANRFQRMVSATYHVYRKARHLKADIYHLHDPELLPVGYLLHLAGSKVIFDSHEDYPKQIKDRDYLPKALLSLISLMLSMLEQFCCKRFDGVITATPLIAEKFDKFTDHVLAIHNYPILKEFSESVSQPMSKKDHQFCYVGNISHHRGILEMVGLMGRLQPDARLALAGHFSERGLRERSTQIEGWSRVNEYGVVDRKKVAEILHQSDVGLLLLHPIPNYVDALPVKLFEYMAAGIPVIASDFVLWRQIIEEAGCGIMVDPLNPDSVVEAALYLMSNPAEAARMGANGKKAVHEQFNWSAEEQNLLQFYQTITSRTIKDFLS